MPAAWIDPRLLQLVALGTQDDPYLADGRHLRWFFHPTLGFPRTGFRLRRRPALLSWDPGQLDGLGGVVRQQPLTESGIASGDDLDGETFAFDPVGLTVSHQGGPDYMEIPDLPGVLSFRLDDRPLVLDFGPPAPAPSFGPEATDPAAYVALVVWYHAEAGRVEANAWFDPREEGGLVHQVATETPDKPDGEWVEQILVLHGGLIDRVEVTGEMAVVVEVQWIPTRAYAQDPDWEELEAFFLPLTDHPPYYPQWTGLAGGEVAEQRLLDPLPRALPPWIEPDVPPPPTDPGEVTGIMGAQYLGPCFDEVDSAMRAFLEGELHQLLPQCRVEEVVAMSSAENPETPAVSRQRPFDLLLAAGADPHLARLLGLATTDADSFKDPFDYVLEADFPELWLRCVMRPVTAEQELESLRGDDVRPWPIFEPDGTVSPEWADVLGPVACLSMATGVFGQPRPLPEPPQALAAETADAPWRRPVPAQVDLSWDASQASLLANPLARHLFFAVWRQGDKEILLNRPDPDTGLPMPIVVTASSQSGQRSRYTDRQLDDFGPYTYRVSAMDLWGRFSPYADAFTEVVDRVAPPPPSNLELELTGDAAAAPTWDKVALTFDWPAALKAEAPDLRRFRIHLKQGQTAVSREGDGTGWGRFEHRPGATDPPLVVSWPVSPGPLAAPPGLTASVAVEPLADGGERISVSAGAVECPFDAAGFAHLSVTVTAVDQAGNESSWAPFAATRRVDESVPAVPRLPAELQWATLPDARMRSFYSLPMALPAGTTAQVLRAAQVSLLRAGGTDDATWEALDEAGRVAHLQQLAVAHPDAFRLETATPLEPADSSYRLQLPGGDRGWTVVVVRPSGRTGVRAPWPTEPTAFAVVAVPHPIPPPLPALEEVRPVDAAVRIRVGPDRSGSTRRLRLYRTRFGGRARDARRMRPVLAVEVTAPPPGEEPAAVLLLDDTAQPYRTYHYRVVAEGDGGLRSEATVPVQISTWTSAPPQAGEVLAVDRLAGDPTSRLVRFRVERPDYAVELLRRAQHSVGWERVGSGPLDLSAMPSIPDPGGPQYSLTDSLPPELADYPHVYRVRVRDPDGKLTAGPPLLETVPEETP